MFRTVLDSQAIHKPSLLIREVGVYGGELRVGVVGF